MSETTPTAHAEFIQGLRELAEFYTLHPEMPLPPYPSWTIYAEHWRFGGVEQAKEVVITAAKAFGKASKEYTESSFTLKKEFPGKISIEVYTDRKTVCTPKVVGRKTVPGHLIPAEPERYIPASEEDDVVWECHSLLAPGQAEAEKLLDPVADFLRPNPVADVYFEEEKPGDERTPDIPF